MIKVRLKAEQCALEGFQLLCLVVLQSLLLPPSGESARQFIINPSCGKQTKVITGNLYFLSTSYSMSQHILGKSTRKT